MYYGDYGNYDARTVDRKKDYELYQLGKEKKAAADAISAKNNTIIAFPKTAEARSTDALGAYGKAAFNIGQKVTASALPLTDEAQAMIGRYFTPEQEQRVTENMLNYFG